jgi:hypothetical protein
MREKGTQTSPFGSPGRIGHDSSAFYADKRFLQDLHGSTILIEYPLNYPRLYFSPACNLASRYAFFYKALFKG